MEEKDKKKGRTFKRTFLEYSCSSRLFPLKLKQTTGPMQEGAAAKPAVRPSPR